MTAHLRRILTPRTQRRERSGPHALHFRSRPAAGADERRARNSGGPQDRALYDCSCGSSFAANVSASVRCPRCDELQVW